MLCPRCGYDGSPAHDTHDDLHDGSFVTIARFAWASEAGYFSHELGLQDDFETRIVWEDQSDKIHGFWQGEYLLQVPADWADEARLRLRHLLDEQSEPAETASRRWPRSANAEETFDTAGATGINWVPLILTLTAGSVAAISYQVWSRHRERPPIAREEFPEELTQPVAVNRIFVDEHDGTRVTVRFDPESERLILSEDVDGDSSPDRRRVLRATP